MFNWHGLGFILTARDQASAILQRVERSFGSLEGVAKKVGRGVTTALVGAGAFAGGMAALKGLFEMTDDAAKFELTMNQLKVAAQASGETMGKMRTAAFDLAAKGIHGPQEIAEAMETLVKAGYDAGSAMRDVEAVMRLMTASGGEITSAAEAANIISMSQKTWGKGAMESVDMLAKMANMTATNFRELDTLISHVMRGTGIKPTMEQTLAMVGLTRNLAGNMETAATTVGVLFERISNLKATKPLEDLGFQFFDINKNAFKQPFEIMEQFLTNENWKKLDERAQLGIIGKAFGSRQGKVIQSFFKQVQEQGITTLDGLTVRGVDAINYLTNGLKNSAGASEQYANAALSSFSGQIAYLKGQSKTLRIIVGEALIEGFRPLVRLLGQGASILGRMLEAIPKPIINIIAKIMLVGLALATAAAGLVLFVAITKLGLLLWGLMGLAIVKALIVPLLIATAVLGGLVLLGAAFYAAFSENIGGIGEGFTAFIDKVKLGFQAIGQLFSKGFIEGDVADQLLGKGNEGVLAWVKEIWMWWGRLQAFGSSMWDGFVLGIKESKVIEMLVQSFYMLLEVLGITTGSAKSNQATMERWAQIGFVVGQVLSYVATALVMAFTAVVQVGAIMIAAVRVAWFLVGDIIIGVFDAIMSIWQIFKAVFTGDWTGFWHGIVNLLFDIISLIVSIIGAVFKTVLGIVDMVGNAFGAKWNLSGEMDKQITEGLVSIKGQKFVDAGMTSPANGPGAAVVKAQAQASKESGQAAAPKVEVNPVVQASFNIDGQQFATAMAKTTKSSENRAFRPAGSFT